MKSVKLILWVLLSCFTIQLVNAQKLPLLTGSQIQKGTKYMSPSGKHYLLFQPDGNLVVMTASNQKVWGLDQVFKNYTQIATMQLGIDANLVANNNKNGYLWSALKVSANGSSQLTINQAGALQIVAPGSKILWSSDGNLKSTEFILPPGWTQYRMLKDPKIIIYGSRMATAKGLDAVAYIYSEMTRRFSAKYPKNKFNDFAVYLTNGEPWPEMKKLNPVGTMWADVPGERGGEFLLGGANNDFLWIDEQMICKTGIRTRNEMFKAGRLKQGDNEARTFDQVVHEFTHCIMYRYALENSIENVYRGAAMGPVERFPWSVQNWFGVPAGEIKPGEEAFIKDIFTSRTSFSPDIYNKGVNVSNIIVTPTVNAAPVVPAPAANTQTTRIPVQKNALNAGETLLAGEPIYSQNGKFILIMENVEGSSYGQFFTFATNNFSMARDKGIMSSIPTTAMGKANGKAQKLAMQADGNVVCYDDETGSYIWDAKTNSNDPAKKPVKLVVENDGSIGLYNAKGEKVLSYNGKR